MIDQPVSWLHCHSYGVLGENTYEQVGRVTLTICPLLRSVELLLKSLVNPYVSMCMDTQFEYINKLEP